MEAIVLIILAIVWVAFVAYNIKWAFPVDSNDKEF